jgi:hypothetical protein
MRERAFIVAAKPISKSAVLSVPFCAYPDRPLRGWTPAYLFERRQVAGAVPNAFLKAREKAASEL